jgi:predicted TIM-barrel fold metal-dependent hydrolase
VEDQFAVEPFTIHILDEARDSDRAETHPRYRGPVIDAHTHFDPNEGPSPVDIDRANGIERTLNLWNMSWPPPDFRSWRAPWPEEFEDRLLLGHAPDLSRIGDREFGEEVRRGIGDAAQLGARALKVWKNLGLRLREREGHIVAVDDGRLDALWDAAAEHDLPVFIHVADPVAFFQPLGPANERQAELAAHPDWWFGAPEFPPFDELIAQFRRLVRTRPGTTFVGVHMGCYSENLAFVASMLDESPNYHIDTSSRIGEIGRQDPGTVREFFTTYADRILFGSDLARTAVLWLPEEGQYAPLLEDFFQLHWDFFETARRDLPHPFPLQGSWTVNGIDLPDDVLERLYYRDADRLLRKAPGDRP